MLLLNYVTLGVVFYHLVSLALLKRISLIFRDERIGILRER